MQAEVRPVSQVIISKRLNDAVVGQGGVMSRHRRSSGHSLWSLLFFLGTAGLVLIGDLVSKQLAFEYVAGQPIVLNPNEVGDPKLSIPPHAQVVVIPHVLSLKLTVNTGAIFGLGKGAKTFFITMTAVAVGVIGWMYWHSDRRDVGMHLALGLILAGAMGNLYDRVRYHAVRDLLYLFPGVSLPLGWTWPNGSTELYPWIFNVADTALVFGVAVMTGLMWRRRGDETPSADEVADGMSPP